MYSWNPQGRSSLYVKYVGRLRVNHAGDGGHDFQTGNRQMSK